MSHMPPAQPQGYPPVGYQPQGFPPGYPQSTSNPAAVVSLVCGIIGCLMVTAVIGIVTGILALGKARPPVGGRGMAITGIILSILWIVVGIGGYFAFKGGMSFVRTEIAKLVSTEAQSVLADIEKDGTAGVSLIPANRVAELNGQLKTLGTCTNVKLSDDFSFMEAAQAQTFTLTGTATFSKGGTKSITVETPKIENRNGQQTIDIKDIIIK